MGWLIGEPTHSGGGLGSRKERCDSICVRGGKGGRNRYRVARYCGVIGSSIAMDSIKEIGFQWKKRERK